MKIEIHQANRKKDSQFFKQSKILIGSSPKADLVLPAEEGFSPEHLLIELKDGQFYGTDLNSESGVFVQGEALTPNQETKLLTVFPLETGKDTTIFLFDEEEFIAPAQNSSTPPLPEQFAETKKAARNSQPRAKKAMAPPAKGPSKLVLMGGLIGFLAVGAFAFKKYMAAKKEKTTEEKGAPIAVAVANTPEVKKKIYEELDYHTRRSLTSLQQVHKNSLCMTDIEKKLCSTLELKPEFGEGTVIKDGALYVFASFADILPYKANRWTDNLPEYEAEIILQLNWAYSLLENEHFKALKLNQLIIGNFKANEKNEFYFLSEMDVNTEGYSLLTAEEKSQFLAKAEAASGTIQKFLKTYQRTYFYKYFAKEEEVPN